MRKISADECACSNPGWLGAWFHVPGNAPRGRSLSFCVLLPKGSSGSVNHRSYMLLNNKYPTLRLMAQENKACIVSVYQESRCSRARPSHLGLLENSNLGMGWGNRWCVQKWVGGAQFSQGLIVTGNNSLLPQVINPYGIQFLTGCWPKAAHIPCHVP